MNIADISILIIVGIVFVIALRKVLGNLKKGRCCGCEGCTGTCHLTPGDGVSGSKQ